MHTRSTPKPALVALYASLLSYANAGPIEPRLNNGLAKTPPMGWNSYNAYSCYPNETLIHSNAQALVDLGLNTLGYQYVTTDCGWGAENRTSNGTLTWNPTLFPDGFPALGQFLHNLGLKFGVYSDSGIQMCSASSSQVIAGSLYYEQTDADTFSGWGADLLKYDNCYSQKDAGYPDADYMPDTSPSSRYQTMQQALQATGREILFAICEWGVDFPSNWAPPIGNTWRITNDIIPAWRTVYRQVNQIVPQTNYSGSGHFTDLDLLEVGNNVFTNAEEQTHFTLWSICKSPLFISCPLKDGATSISSSSLAILKNTQVIGFNQDSLGVAANLTRRYTMQGYDIWAGPLSGGRTVAALINWSGSPQNLAFNLPDLGIQSAGLVQNIWAGTNSSNVVTSYQSSVDTHGVVLLELSNTMPAGQYSAAAASQKGSTITFSKVYGITSSSAYTLTVKFSRASTQASTITVKSSAVGQSVSANVPAGATSVNLPITLLAANSNTLAITYAGTVSSIAVANPQGTFYPSTQFSRFGGATAVTCTTGTCAPVGAKIGDITPTAGANISIPVASDASIATTRYVEITYCNNDIAFASAFGDGRNARNITIAVNNAAPVRLEVPLSSHSSELFSPDNGWYDSATLGVLVSGWGTGSGNDVISISNVGGDAGVQSYGADFVGLRIL